MKEEVILVDEKDQEIGTMEKMQAHEEARLHRAISIFIFNSAGKLLLQKRASHKYHSGGLWTNSCCTHPRPGENVQDAAVRRLDEEMGMDSELFYGFSFIYKAPFDNGLTEYEYDHTFIGVSDEEPVLNFSEAEDFKYEYLQDIIDDFEVNPHLYTEWFKICAPIALKHINAKQTA